MTEDRKAARRAWLLERQTGLGGSDIAAILGEDPHRTQLDIYQSKVGEIVETDNPAIRRGNRQEPVAREFYHEVTGREVLPGPSMLRDADHECLFVNLDGLVKRDPTTIPAVEVGHETGSLELKAPGLRNFSKMRAAGISRAYYLQVQHGLGITGYEFGAFAAFSAELDQMLTFDIPRDDELIRVIRTVSVEWWHKHVVTHTPPQEDAIRLPEEFNVPSGEIVRLDSPQWQSAVLSFLEAQELADMAAELKETAKAACIAAMGNFQVVEGCEVRAFNRPQKGRATFDKKALAAAVPLDANKVRELIMQAGVASGASIQEAARVADHQRDKFLREAGLNLSQFEKVGAPFTTFRMFPISKRALTDGE